MHQAWPSAHENVTVKVTGKMGEKCGARGEGGKYVERLPARQHQNCTPLAAPLAHHTKTPKLHTTTSSTLASEKRRPFCSFQNVNFIITG